jgi:hypothetical protein
LQGRLHMGHAGAFQADDPIRPPHVAHLQHSECDAHRSDRGQDHAPTAPDKSIQPARGDGIPTRYEPGALLHPMMLI